MTNGITIPAIRGKQGDRIMYLLLPNLRELTNFFSHPPEIVPDQRAQRALDPRHAAEIADYVQSNSADYVLGALTYASDSEGTFVPSELNPSIGMLTIPLGARIRSIDGQHRLAGIHQAIELVDELSTDNIAALLYIEPDLRARRQMFSDMNATPKVVAKSLNVGFDDRDPFARATNKLVSDHPLLKNRVETEAARVKAGSDKFFALGAIYDSLKRLMVGPNGRVRNLTAFDEAEIYRRGEHFFDMLARRPEYKDAQSPDLVDKLRTQSLLFSSTMLRVIAGALFKAREQKIHEDVIAPALLEVDFRPNAKMWRATGFVSQGKTTPNARNQEVFAATTELAKQFGWHV